MLARIVIFEGPDGVGKTTLIKYIKEQYGKDAYYMHLRVHKDMKLWHTASARLAISKKQDGKLVLLDRHWPSEQFYSHIYREGPSYDPEEIYRRLKLEGALYVWCLPSDIEQVKQNHRINREKRKEAYYDIDKVIQMYNDYWNYPTSNLINFHQNNLMDTLAPLKKRPDFIRYDMFKEGHDLNAVTERIIDKCFQMNL